MLAIERRREILSRLTTDGKVLVCELAKDFGVTEETIRRDLEKLDKETSRRVIDIISGASYALGGSTQKVAKGILLVAPYNVDIMADVRDEIENGAFFPWEE